MWYTQWAWVTCDYGDLHANELPDKPKGGYDEKSWKMANVEITPLSKFGENRIR